jgi:hypothetical protein
MVKRVIGIVILVIAMTNIYGQVKVEKVEASFIANFMRYARWPQQENFKEFIIGIYGKNQSIFKELSAITQGKKFGFATINVVEVKTIDEMKNCQILFFPNAKAFRLKQNLSTFDGIPIMTITEEFSTPNYSIINFTVKNNKLVFSLNSDIAQQKNIAISKKLAQMAAN